MEEHNYSDDELCSVDEHAPAILEPLGLEFGSFSQLAALAKGHFSTVESAVHTSSRRPVALKYIHVSSVEVGLSNILLREVEVSVGLPVCACLCVFLRVCACQCVCVVVCICVCARMCACVCACAQCTARFCGLVCVEHPSRLRHSQIRKKQTQRSFNLHKPCCATRFIGNKRMPLANQLTNYSTNQPTNLPTYLPTYLPTLSLIHI